MRGQGPPVEARDRAEEELERRSRYLSGLIEQRRKQEQHTLWKASDGNAGIKGGSEVVTNPSKGKLAAEEKETSKKVLGGTDGGNDGDLRGNAGDHELGKGLRVRATDMPLEMQKRAFGCAWEVIDSMPKLDSKRLAQTLKKEFDASYGPAWHCIVGTSFGSYVTHSLGGFLYFSIDKVYVLLFRTVVEPLSQ